MTRKRLYLETIETILGRSHKVLIDAKGANGNLIYLPLDKLLDRAAVKEPEVTTDSTAAHCGRQRPGCGCRRRPRPDGPLMLQTLLSAPGGARDRGC